MPFVSSNRTRNNLSNHHSRKIPRNTCTITRECVMVYQGWQEPFGYIQSINPRKPSFKCVGEDLVEHINDGQGCLIDTTRMLIYNKRKKNGWNYDIYLRMKKQNGDIAVLDHFVNCEIVCEGYKLFNPEFDIYENAVIKYEYKLGSPMYKPFEPLYSGLLVTDEGSNIFEGMTVVD